MLRGCAWAVLAAFAMCANGCALFLTSIDRQSTAFDETRDYTDEFLRFHPSGPPTLQVWLEGHRLFVEVHPEGDCDMYQHAVVQSVSQQRNTLLGYRGERGGKGWVTADLLVGAGFTALGIWGIVNTPFALNTDPAPYTGDLSLKEERGWFTISIIGGAVGLASGLTRVFQSIDGQRQEGDTRLVEVPFTPSRPVACPRGLDANYEVDVRSGWLARDATRAHGRFELDLGSDVASIAWQDSNVLVTARLSDDANIATTVGYDLRESAAFRAQADAYAQRAQPKPTPPAPPPDTSPPPAPPSDAATLVDDYANAPAATPTPTPASDTNKDIPPHTLEDMREDSRLTEIRNGGCIYYDCHPRGAGTACRQATVLGLRPDGKSLVIQDRGLWSHARLNLPRPGKWTLIAPAAEQAGAELVLPMEQVFAGCKFRTK